MIPAHNEAESLPSVVAELRACAPHLDLLVVDDGSTDGTATLLPGLDVRWLRLPDRMGVGSAMRAGLRYAARLGYQAVVRVDGDGQHRADEIERLLTPICTDAADVVLGSRYTSRDGGEPRGVSRLTRRVLGWCISALTGRRVTDPTSGFCALGARAIAPAGRASSHRLSGAGIAPVPQPECAARDRSPGPSPDRALAAHRRSPPLDWPPRAPGCCSRSSSSRSEAPSARWPVIDRIQIVALSVSALLLLTVLELVRRRKLTEEYSFLWIACALALLGLSAKRRVLDVVAPGSACTTRRSCCCCS